MSKLVEEDLEQHIIDQECYICFEPCDQKAPCACNKKCHPACHLKFNADRQQCEVCLAYYKNPKYPWYIRTYRLIATLTVLNALLFLIFFIVRPDNTLPPAMIVWLVVSILIIVINAWLIFKPPSCLIK